jgi:hypothetical protein
MMDTLDIIVITTIVVLFFTVSILVSLDPQ